MALGPPIYPDYAGTPGFPKPVTYADLGGSPSGTISSSPLGPISSGPYVPHYQPGGFPDPFDPGNALSGLTPGVYAQNGGGGQAAAPLPAASPVGPGGAGPAAVPGNAGGGVTTDPNILNALALEQAGLGSLDAQLRAARERAIIGFGDPTLAGEAGFGLDPQAGAFAQQNYLSGNATLARLDKAHQLARQAVINRLASHGILDSGDLGYLSGQENQAYGNNVYDARQSVLDQLSGLLSGYLNSRAGLENNVIGAQQGALQNYLTNPDLYAQLFGGSTAAAAAKPVAAAAKPKSKAAAPVVRAVTRPRGGGGTRAAMA